jgi:hypothetical protein
MFSAIVQKEPIAVGKIGESELRVLRDFAKSGRFRAGFRASTTAAAYVNAGIFPIDQMSLTSFAESYLDALSHLDLVAIWYNFREASFVRRYAKDSKLTKIKGIEPFYYNNPWTLALKDKRVVIVSPFAESMARQEKKLQQVWVKRPELVLKCELIYIKCPLSPALTPPVFSSWMSTLEDLKGRVADVDFDLAIVGAGAYSLPLVSYAKAKGKAAVHLGGGTQLLFGLKGTRWENSEFFKEYFNESWIRPSGRESPPERGLVENGAYW